MPVLVVIPARLGSTRLPRKPLQPLGGVPLVVRVAQRVAEHGVAEHLVVATDAEEIAEVVRQSGFDAVLTRSLHQSGTDRVNEVASRQEYRHFEEILNVQGDEPFISEGALSGALDQLRRGHDVGTAAVPLDPALAEDMSRVKVVTDPRGRALYFSRAAIPLHRDLPRGSGSRGDDLFWQHLGVYAYRPEALARLAACAPTPLELAERLEQLRALECGLSIGVARIHEPVAPSVDTAADLRRAEEHWHITHEVLR